jgi:hypothetical protein
MKESSMKESRMTEKKKINLGPLPEELDYSKYEETVTRWDRVIAALIALLLVVLVVYLLWPAAENGAENPSSLPADIAIQHAAPVQDDSLAEPVRPAEEAAVDTAPAVRDEQPVQNETDQAPPDNADAESDTAATEDLKPQASAAFAIVKILNSSISNAVLTLDLKNQIPGEALPSDLVLPAAGITKVILFTEMQDLKGQTLYHDWYRNGKRQARVKIPVNVQNQSSFSSKFINSQMTGEWQVKVVDAKSRLYVEADFKVSAP